MVMKLGRLLKNYAVFVLIFSLLLLAACEIEQGVGDILDPDNNPETETEGNGITDDQDPESDRDTGEKTLIWFVDSYTLPQEGVDPDIYNKFNDLLSEKGADYSVEFIGYDSVDTVGYQNELVRMMESREQVDLLMTGPGAEIEVDGGYSYIYTIPESVENELLEPLNDYLETEQGQYLYQQIDDKLWERHKIDQTLYGVSHDWNVFSTIAFFINLEGASDLGIDVPQDIEGIEVLEEFIKEADELTDDIIPFASLASVIYDSTGYSYFENGIAIDYDAEGVPYAFNPFEKDEVVTLINTLSSLAKEDYYSFSPQTFDEVNKGNYFSLFRGVNPLVYQDDLLYPDQGEPVRVQSYEVNQQFIEPLLNGITGIASWSNYKEEAFDLLTRVNTDPDLSNLLYYGIEGEHYELVDGRAIPLDHGKRVPSRDSPANPIITHPEGNEPVNKEELIREWLANAELSPLVGFELDQTGIESELEEIKSIYDDHWGLWRVRAFDVESELAEVNQKLQEAGINDVLDNINAQLRSNWEE